MTRTSALLAVLTLLTSVSHAAANTPKPLPPEDLSFESVDELNQLDAETKIVRSKASHDVLFFMFVMVSSFRSLLSKIDTHPDDFSNC